MSSEFRKGVDANRGMAQEILPVPEIQAASLNPVSYPQEKWTTIPGNYFPWYVRPWWSPTTSRQPLFRTSEQSILWLEMITKLIPLDLLS